MTSIVLPAPTSGLPPAAYHASEIRPGFELVRFEIEPSPMASLVTVSAWLRGRIAAGWSTPGAMLSILDEGQMVSCAGDGSIDHGGLHVFSTTATIRVAPNERRIVDIALQLKHFTIEDGGCTLARQAVTF